ncbi:MAG: sulfatase-like hydrolase/transferase [Candidatus Latescibacterota bacterium]|jgi:arylsulfatase A-like enzyme
MAKNAIFILSDQHRHDAWGKYNPAIKTPNLDRLAREGTVYENAYCTSQACVPSRACLLTGLYPEVHGVSSNSEILPPGLIEACVQSASTNQQRTETPHLHVTYPVPAESIFVQT